MVTDMVVHVECAVIAGDWLPYPQPTLEVAFAYWAVVVERIHYLCLQALELFRRILRNREVARDVVQPADG